MNLNNLKQLINAKINEDDFEKYMNDCQGDWWKLADEIESYSDYTVEMIVGELDLWEDEELDENYYKELEDYAKALALERIDIDKLFKEVLIEQDNRYLEMLDYYDMIGAR